MSDVENKEIIEPAGAEEVPAEAVAEEVAAAVEETPAVEVSAEEIEPAETTAEPADEVTEPPVAEASVVAEESATEEAPAVEVAEAEVAPAEAAVAEEAPAEKPSAVEASAVEIAEAEVAPAEETPAAAAPAAAAPAPKFPIFNTPEEVVAYMHTLTEDEAAPALNSQEVGVLKNIFYHMNTALAEQALKAHIEAGGEADTFVPQPNPLETEFKELLTALREKRAKEIESETQQLEDNYQKKLAIIERIKEIMQKPDEVNKYYNEVKGLQQQWNEIKAVPAPKSTDLWKSYQVCVEQFYDTLKLNNAFRAYDFKKNLELKQALCERAEKLAESADVLAAFRALQQLHQEFREIGPVERDLREQVWNRFKAASTTISKRHQEYFESRKQQEKENLEKKTALCEQLEALDITTLKSFADWNAMSDKVIALQKEWRTVGFASRSVNNKLFERFRKGCDAFFSAKSAYFKGVRDGLSANLKQKEELVKQAEALKDSTDWQETTAKLVELQKQWRQIGAVPKKVSDDVWKRFNAACDAFFDAKKAAGAGGRSEQADNLAKKRAIIAELAAIEPDGSDIRPQLRKAQDDWNAIGFVPFRQKEKIYQEFRAQMDRLYGALNDGAVRRRVSRFRNEVSATDGGVKDKLSRQAEILESEIKTYENNLGFLSISSRSNGGNALLEELNRKVEKLKSDLNEIRLKQKALREKQQEESAEAANEE